MNFTARQYDHAQEAFFHHYFCNYVFGIKVQNKNQNRTIVFLVSAFCYLSFSIIFESILDKQYNPTKNPYEDFLNPHKKKGSTNHLELS